MSTMNKLQAERKELEGYINELETERDGLQQDGIKSIRLEVLKETLSRYRARLAGVLSEMAKLEGLSKEQAQAAEEQARIDAVRRRFEVEIPARLNTENQRINALHKELRAEMAAYLRDMIDQVTADSADHRAMVSEMATLRQQLQEAGVSVANIGGRALNVSDAIVFAMRDALREVFPHSYQV